MTCATVESLMQIKDVTDTDALFVRTIWKMVGPTAVRKLLTRHNVDGKYDNALACKGSVNMKHAAIDTTLNTHGVELLGQRKRNREYVYYCNAGDTYATTVLFDGLHLRVGCIGDLLEKGLITERVQY